MVISAIVAGLLTVSLSATISEVQAETYEPRVLPDKLNQLEREIGKITEDGQITAEEKRNFRKTLGYLEGYRTEAEFNESGNCVKIGIESPEISLETSCLS